jgi:putative phosphoesterase
MNNLVRIGVLSDTHARRISELPPALVDTLLKLDMIVHLGDFHSRELVDEFIKLGNFRGVTGNHDFGDIQLALPKKDNHGILRQMSVWETCCVSLLKRGVIL